MAQTRAEPLSFLLCRLAPRLLNGNPFMKRSMLTLFLLLAPVAYGATQLDAMRAGAASARAQVSGTRSAQLQGQAELNKLGARIEELKAQAKGKLLPGSELDAALKKSQELSASL